MSGSVKIKEWFNQNRHHLTQHGTWLQGGEPNTIQPQLYDCARIRVLIVRLSSYQDVSAGITHSYLYQMAAGVDDCYVDMAFLPPEKDEKLMIEAQIPLLTATNCKLPPSAFDVIAISNSVLQELINLPAMLYHSGIPLSRQQRIAAASPLVILGGSNSYTQSILHGPVDAEGNEGLVDAVIIGDGEEVLKQTLEIVRDHRHLDRQTLLIKLQNEVPGFYNPVAYSQQFSGKGQLNAIIAQPGAPMPVRSNKTACTPASPTFTGGPMLYSNGASSHVILTAGCPSFCSFCKESWEQKPYRETSLNDTFAAALQLKAKMGLSEIALMTFNANTYSHIFSLVEQLNSVFDRVAIKSQRFDAVVNSPELLDLQFDAGKRTYTCAMEGISERLRTLLQKNLDEKTIFAGLDQLIQRDMRQMKVFLILTGYEKEEDLLEFQNFLESFKQRITGSNSRPRITFSFATLFRAPQTPMQYAPRRRSDKEMRQILDRLGNMVRAADFEARVSAGPEDALVSEYIAFADRRHTPVLVDASISGGFRYRGEISRRLLEFWRDQMQKRKLPPLGDQERDNKTVFPWDDIDTGIDKNFLFKVWSALSDGIEMTACIARPWGSASCSGCGACASAEQIKRLTSMGPPVGDQIKKLPVTRLNSQWLLLRIPDQWAFCEREFITAAIARRLMLSCPGLVKSFRRIDTVQPTFFSSGLALASVSYAGEAFAVPEKIEFADDISILQTIRAAGKIEEFPFPMTLEIDDCGDPQAMSREIDTLLTGYRLKNLKQRHNGWLNWQINSGQAKKAGIDKISINETSRALRLSLIRMPELHMLNKIFSTNAPRIISLASFFLPEA